MSLEKAAGMRFLFISHLHLAALFLIPHAHSADTTRDDLVGKNLQLPADKSILTKQSFIKQEIIMPDISKHVLHDLAPTGKVRVAINYGNPVLVQRNPKTDTPEGISVDLANELAKRLGVQAEFITYEAAGNVVAAIDAKAWDVAFLARDPARAEQILFTEPYIIN